MIKTFGRLGSDNSFSPLIPHSLIVLPWRLHKYIRLSANFAFFGRTLYDAVYIPEKEKHWYL